MSSAHKPDSKQAAPPPEKRKPAGPVITPQVLAIALGIILVVAIIVYYQMVVVKLNNEQAQLDSQIHQTDQSIRTYTEKGSKLDKASEVNLALREKLNSLDYLFLQDQSSVVPFFQNILLPLIESSTLQPGFIEVEDPYVFHINMAMVPFQTLPSSAFFEDVDKSFLIEYMGEKNGVPIETPLDTRPGAFLTPFTIYFDEFAGTYEDCQKFIGRIQQSKQGQLITVHCLANDDGNNSGIFRTNTTWKIAITVYFMNPEKSAQGDTPPEPPGAKSC